MSTYLDLPIEEAVNFLTDGGNDAGVDVINICYIDDGEFLVTIFQGKYNVNELEGKANFPEDGVQKAVHTLQVLFDPYKNVKLNEKIAPKIEEIRSFICDAYASHYLSMLIGRRLLENMGIELLELSHRNFHTILQHFTDDQSAYHASAMEEVRNALKSCYGERTISLQQLAATFRRGDLLEMLVFRRCIAD